MSLSREDILNVKDISIEEVEVPEWGGSIYVKSMTGTERDAFEASIVRANSRSGKANVNMENIRAKIAANTICDENGELLFTKHDITVLGNKSASALQRVFEVAQRLSGITEEAVKELAEGLEQNPTEDSPSD